MRLAGVTFNLVNVWALPLIIGAQWWSTAGTQHVKIQSHANAVAWSQLERCPL